MNKFIKEQLENCKVADVPDFDDNTVLIHIPQKIVYNKYNMQVGNHYKIEVKNYIVNPYEGFNLNSNWNNNIPIVDYVLDITIVQTMGKMIKFSGVGESGTYYKDMWLPLDGFEIKSGM